MYCYYYSYSFLFILICSYLFLFVLLVDLNINCNTPYLISILQSTATTLCATAHVPRPLIGCAFPSADFVAPFIFLPISTSTLSLCLLSFFLLSPLQPTLLPSRNPHFPSLSVIILKLPLGFFGVSISRYLLVRHKHRQYQQHLRLPFFLRESSGSRSNTIRTCRNPLLVDGSTEERSNALSALPASTLLLSPIGNRTTVTVLLDLF